ncbi:MAG TPA: hypothetical protein VHJ69_08750 [Gemmatimonadales bacterium]|jgi:hypothetical protein|nr:hypothetical protein [Gemmatimonadales bacterium]
MPAYKNEQHRVTHRGRDFHFVSYEGRPANDRRGEPAVAAMWYLIQAGKRWPVMPQEPGQPVEALQRALRAWLEANAFTATRPFPPAESSP